MTANWAAGQLISCNLKLKRNKTTNGAETRSLMARWWNARSTTRVPGINLPFLKFGNKLWARIEWFRWLYARCVSTGIFRTPCARMKEALMKDGPINLTNGCQCFVHASSHGVLESVLSRRKKSQTTSTISFSQVLNLRPFTQCQDLKFAFRNCTSDASISSATRGALS